jgi:phage terminase small subunit
MSLTPKQQRFVEEYLIDLNATQAAIRAGYSSKTAMEQGYQLLRKTSVAGAIAEAQAELARRTEITQEKVLAELAKIGFADMRKLLRWTGNLPKMDETTAEQTGEVEISVANFVQLFDSDQLDDDIAAAISEISQTKDGALKVKLHDKQAALVAIGRHLGMFKDKIEHTGKDGKDLPAPAIAIFALPDNGRDRAEPK